MKKLLCVLLPLVCIFSLSGCTKITTEKGFAEFSEKWNEKFGFRELCTPAEYYGNVQKYTETAKTVNYFCDIRNRVVFTSYIMTQKCSYDDAAFTQAVEGISGDTKLVPKFTDCKIGKADADVYYSADISEETKKTFGFVLIYKAEKKIDFCWFADMDIDISCNNEDEFIDFYRSCFVKTEME